LAKASAVAGLLTGALVWGLIRYPYRLLEAAGVQGTVATLTTYAVALVAACIAFRRDLGALRRPDWMLVLIGLSAGWTNLGYVLGMIHGQVMQVLLLFYLAPLWTVVFAALLLGERPGSVGFLVILLSLAGAALMLWLPGISLPLPGNAAEWFGLSAGIGFALSNVLIRKARHLQIPVKAVAVFAGVVATALVAGLIENDARLSEPLSAGPGALLLLVVLGLVIFATNLAVQHGLMHVSANRAIVLLLSELVVAALSSYVLALEAMRWNQWAGGTMIVAATLLSGRLGQDHA
jgi:drug/metabolite transporter (DMT)-like permease